MVSWAYDPPLKQRWRIQKSIYIRKYIYPSAYPQEYMAISIVLWKFEMKNNIALDESDRENFEAIRAPKFFDWGYIIS